jgi:hypothetical protein
VGDFPAIVASPTFAIVPPTLGSGVDPTTVAASGGYHLDAITTTEFTLLANERYWAGRPAIGTVHLVTDLGGRSPVVVFEDGEVDYTAISPYDASWVAYDRTFGPALREVASMSLTYYGFDTAAARRSTTFACVVRSGRRSTGGASRRSAGTARRSQRPAWCRRGSLDVPTRTSCRSTTRWARATSSPRLATPEARAFRR